MAIISESKAKAVQNELSHTKPHSKDYKRLSKELKSMLYDAAQLRRIEEKLSRGNEL